jgi:hypothetical protein
MDPIGLAELDKVFHPGRKPLMPGIRFLCTHAFHIGYEAGHNNVSCDGKMPDSCHESRIRRQK